MSVHGSAFIVRGLGKSLRRSVALRVGVGDALTATWVLKFVLNVSCCRLPGRNERREALIRMCGLYHWNLYGGAGSLN